MTTSRRFSGSPTELPLLLAEPGPERLVVAIGLAGEAHSEGEDQILPLADAVDALPHQLLGDADALLPGLRHAPLHPVSVAGEVDGPVAARRTAHLPPGDDA